MPTKPDALTQDQFALALHRLNPFYAYRWTSETDYEWRGIEQPDGSYQSAPVPTSQQITDAWNAHAAEETQTESDAAATRQAIVNIAQGAAGKTLATLTANEVKALVACLLFKEGAVNPDTTIRPLNQWVKPA